MYLPKIFSSCKSLVSNFVTSEKSVLPSVNMFFRSYAKKSNAGDCRRATVDIPPEVDSLCPKSCETNKNKEGILHRIKLKVIEGGTNFGSSYILYLSY